MIIFFLFVDFKIFKKSNTTLIEQISYIIINTETENKDYALYKENERKKACKFYKYNSIFSYFYL